MYNKKYSHEELIVEVKVILKKSTINELKKHIDDFDMTIDDVVQKLIREYSSMKNTLNKSFHEVDKDNYQYEKYVIHKLSRGKISVTENGEKIQNMKKVIIEAAESLQFKQSDFNPNFTTYELGRLFFKNLQNIRG